MHRSPSRVAIVAGLRTPFARHGTTLARASAVALGAQVVRELLERTADARARVERVVFGQVAVSAQAPNIAREVVLGAGLPATVDAYSVARACATSYQAVADLAAAIASGDIACGVAGGADSASNPPIAVSPALARALADLDRARSLGQRWRALRGVRPRDLLPVAPALKEPSSRYTMGQAAEKMARENAISREDQDDLAHLSHGRAARAWSAGHFDSQVMTARVAPDYAPVTRDNPVRDNSSRDDYRRLRPAFDRRHGTVTAGNSSPLTDGAAALLLMREDLAGALGVEPLGYLRSWAFAAIDPDAQMLMGPAYATPRALERAGMTLADLDLIDMHEAFAAQVLSNTRALESARFARDQLGLDAPVGEIDPERFNIDGGSIALGHPFAATGARQILQALHGLRRVGGAAALCTACAAGGLGAAMVLERA